MITGKRYIIFMFILTITSVNLSAQKGNTVNYFLSGLRIMGNVGASQMLTEIPYDFSTTINEFNHNPGLTFNVELSKQISSRWELSGSVSFSNLNGETNSPVFSANGYHDVMRYLRDEPIEYSNNQMAEIFMARYSFPLRAFQKNTYKVKSFVNAGVGVVSHVAALTYKNGNSENLIFGKRRGEFTNASVSNAIYLVGTGIRIQKSPRIEFFATFNTKFMGYDFLDVVHNYNIDGTRENVIGIYSELTIGISYLAWYPLITEEKRKSKKVKQKNLPFYYRR